MAGTPRRLVGILVSLTLMLGSAPASAEPTFPMLSGRVVDDANLLTPADKQTLTADLKALEDKSSDQVVVVTLPSLQGYSIEDYGYQLGRHRGNRDEATQQWRAPHRRAERAQSAYRSGTGARARSHRCPIQNHH